MRAILQDTGNETGLYNQFNRGFSHLKTGEQQFLIINNTLIEINECLKQYLHNFLKSFLVQEYVENLTEAIKEPKSVINKKYKAADLQQQYEKEIERNKSYFTLDATILKNFFAKIQDTITNINYEKISLEFTPDSSFFFNILINTKIKAHIEIYLEDTSDIMQEAFFNIFENRRSIKSGFGKIIDIVREINFY